MTFFSIIIPCYNVAPYIEETVKTVFQQGYNHWELILINDASKDDTWEKIKGFSGNEKVKVLSNARNSGVSYTRNRGIQEAKGDYVLFLDGDDFLKPGLLTALDEFIKASPELELVSFGYTIENGNQVQHLGDRRYDKRIFDGMEFLRLYLDRSLRQHLCSLAVKRSLLLEEGLEFDETTHAGEDQEFQILAMFHSRRVGYLAGEYFRYMIRESSFMHMAFHEKRLSVLEAMGRLEKLFRQEMGLYPHFINYASMEYLSLLKHALKSEKTALVEQVVKEDWLLKKNGPVFANKQSLVVHGLKMVRRINKPLFLRLLKRM